MSTEESTVRLNKKQITYRCGYKYQLVEDYQIFTDIVPVDAEGQPSGVGNDWVYLSKSGLLILQRGYACDGPSGPTEDTEDSLRASFIHDGLYQLLRQHYLPPQYKVKADRFFLKILLEDGMFPPRAAAWYAAVSAFGPIYRETFYEKPPLLAPLVPSVLPVTDSNTQGI